MTGSSTSSSGGSTSSGGNGSAATSSSGSPSSSGAGAPPSAPVAPDTTFSCKPDPQGAGASCVPGSTLTLANRKATSFSFTFDLFVADGTVASKTLTAKLVDGRQWLYQDKDSSGKACGLQFDPNDDETDVLVNQPDGCADLLFQKSDGVPSTLVSTLAGAYVPQ
jgi:hypothetical protein